VAGMRIAFEILTCASFPSVQSLYTVEVAILSALATSRTVRSDTEPPTVSSNSHTKGVPSEPKKVADRSEMGVSVVAAFLGFPIGCKELRAPPSSTEPIVTPEATGSSPVHPGTKAPEPLENPRGPGALTLHLVSAG